MSKEAPALPRLLQLLVLPPLIVGLVVFLILASDLETRSAEQQRKFGEATASQLSDYLTQYVANGDMLSLNVVTSRLAESELVSFIAVYDDTDALIAQSGRMQQGLSSYTSEITFQDSMIGYVRVALPGTAAPNYMLLLIPLVIVILLAVFAWQKPISIVNWLYPKPAVTPDVEASSEAVPTTVPDPVAEEPDNAVECILVARVRPAHHMERHFDSFFAAAEHFHGIVEQTTPEELVIHFDGADAMADAASVGFLIRELTVRKQGNMRFGGTLDLVDDETRRKAASYLASISEGDLLIAGGEWLLEDCATLQTFHHSLVDSEDLRRVSSLANQDQLSELADQLPR